MRVRKCRLKPYLIQLVYKVYGEIDAECKLFFRKRFAKIGKPGKCPGV